MTSHSHFGANFCGQDAGTVLEECIVSLLDAIFLMRTQRQRWDGYFGAKGKVRRVQDPTVSRKSSLE